MPDAVEHSEGPDANKARADSLRQGNQELIAANHLIEILPQLVEAAAHGVANANLTVLNGAQGVNEVIAGMVGQGMSILDLLKRSSAISAGNGAAPGGPDAAPLTGAGGSRR